MTDGWLRAWGLGSVAFGGASLLVPLYLVALGAGPLALGVLAATAAAAGAPGAIVVGRIADRTGRRRVFVVAGLGAVALTMAAIPLTAAISIVIALNAVLWFAVAAVGPVATLLVTAGSGEAGWPAAIARLNKAQGWGWAAGLVLGAVWTGTLAAVQGPLAAQRSYFLACAVLAAVAAVVAYLRLPAEARSPATDRGAAAAASGPPERPRRFTLPPRLSWVPLRTTTAPTLPARGGWLRLLGRPSSFLDRFPPALRLFYLGAICFFAGFGAFFAPLPLFLSGVGFAPGAVFGLYVVSSVASAACYGWAGRLSDRFGLAELQAGSLTIRGLSLPAVAAVGGLWATTLLGTVAATLAFAVIGATWAVIAVAATTYVTRLAPASIRGEAMGVYVALASLAAGGGSLVGGALGAVGYGLAFGTAGGLVLLGAIAVLGAGRLERRRA